MTPFRSRLRLLWRKLLTRLTLAGFAILFVVLFPGDTPGGGTLQERVLGQSKDVLFNYAAWELNAIFAKIAQLQSGPAAYLDEAQRSAFVVNYLDRVTELQQVNGQIEALYADPARKTPDPALLARRDTLAAEVAAKQPLAESIVETQIAAVLRDEGFATLGEVFPPVSAQITELPMLLVISPRDTIRRDLAINTVYLNADQMEALESSIDRALNVSSLVVPLGGLALYPSMVIQTWSGPFLFETVAHEWSHHYLYFFPLGLEYLNQNGETLIINETTASLFGKEVGRRALLRFYANFPQIMRMLPPDPLLVPTPRPAATPAATPTPTPDPPPFDYGAAMNETRVTVDALLAEGKIEQAEAYMAERRRVFAEKGYVFRKINQAFFAFYGGYQSPGGGGTAGQDPIGPAIGDLRRASPSLKAWMEQMRTITSRAQLLAARDALGR